MTPHLFAGEPKKYISHDALPLALENPLLQDMEQLQVLLDQESQRRGKGPVTEEGKR